MALNVTFAALVWGAPEWFIPAVVILIAAGVALAWGYSQARAAGWVRATALGLKTAGLLLLAACLLEPLWTGSRARPGENLVLIVADNSQSMLVRGQGEAKSPGEQIGELLQQADAPWQVRLGQDFEVRRYQFDARLEGTTSFAALKFDGRSSSLGATLASLAERFRGRPVAAILLATDGNATDLGEDLASLTSAGAPLPPIYPLVTPATSPAHDVSVQDVAVSQTNFEDSPVTLRADIAAPGYAGQEIVCQLLDEKGKQLEQQTAQPSDDERATFRFQFRPEKAGVSFYRVRAAALSELSQFDAGADTREATLANNTRLALVDRGSGPFRVLYVSGRPNWEFKFLRRAIEEDKQVNLVGLIRIAKREPKFEWRSRPGESTNPLLRGFGDKSPDEAERYDQPVLIRLGTENEAELRSGFPQTADQLFGYQALIVDDLEAEFFTHDQMALLRRFVADRGGGLLMLGGSESLEKGQFARSPVADLLPVYLDRGLEPAQRSGELRLDLSRDGWLEPWVRLRKTEQDETARLNEMPGFQTLNQVQGVKPGAKVLATVTDDGGRVFPALIAQRYGRGQSGVLTIGDLWRWKLKSEPENDDQAKAWRQMIRWLVSDVPGRVTVESREARDEPQQPVKLEVRVRDPQYLPLDNANVAITVTPPVGPPIKLEAEAATTEPGLYEARYVPREPGAYRAVATVTDAAGAPVLGAVRPGDPSGGVETGWTADPAAGEFRSLTPNRELLERLASVTQGELVPIDGIQSFVESLPNRKLPLAEQSLYPLWHTAWVFLLAVLCLAGEWGLRRWRGLP